MKQIGRIALLVAWAGLLLLGGSLFVTQMRAQSTQSNGQSANGSNKDKQSGDSAATAGGTGSTAPATTKTNAVDGGAQKQANTSLVWVNTDSGVYHKRGNRYYGKTKRGKYMTEADAIKAGYHASGSGAK